MCALCGLSPAARFAEGVVTGIDPAFEGTPLAALDWGTRLDLPDGRLSVGFLPAGRTLDNVDLRGRTDPTAEPWQTLDFAADERAAILEALSVYETIIPVEIVEADDPDTADFRLFKTEDLGAVGLMFPPAFPPNEDRAGLSGYDATAFDGSLAPGSFAFHVFQHEFGHGFGLDHPHETFGQSDVMAGVAGPRDAGLHALNQGVFTIMTYNDPWPEGPTGPSETFDHGWPMTPMALDIAVLQAKYGANDTHAAGDDVYVLPRENAPGTGWVAIWDTGGRDAIRNDSGRDAVIDLAAATLAYEPGGGGVVSHAAGIRGGFTIANGVTIEDAYGGAGDDDVRGNDADNRLFGRKGADTLWSADGDDAVRGGRGADVVSGGRGEDRLVGGPGADDLVGDAGADRLSGAGGNDTLVGATGDDRLAGGRGRDELWGGNGADTANGGPGDDGLDGSTGDDLLVGAAGDDALYGIHGDDRLRGGPGRDTLLADDGDDDARGGADGDLLRGFAGDDALVGGAGDDLLRGGPGADRLIPGPGADLVRGGVGADRFLVRPGDGADTLADFAPGEDLLVARGFGFDSADAVLETARATEDGLRLELEPGTSVLLAGLGAGALAADDILV